MAKYGKSQKRAQLRDTRMLEVEVARSSIYKPPPKEECKYNEYCYIVDEVGGLEMTVRTWHQKGVMVDFHVSVSEVIDEDTKKAIASADCKNHGSIHFHNELKDPNHDTYDEVYPIRTAEDVDKHFDRSIDQLFDYAVTISSNGR